MYAASRVQERIALAEREFSLRLEYHSTSEVDAFERDLIKQGKYLYDEVGRPCGTQNLTARDSHWMLNEQLLVMCDAAYYLTRYAYLRNEEGVVQRFRFRVPQRIYFDIICDLEERGAAIEILVLNSSSPTASSSATATPPSSAARINPRPPRCRGC
jgi:hypothetical protein